MEWVHCFSAYQQTESQTIHCDPDRTSVNRNEAITKIQCVYIAQFEDPSFSARLMDLTCVISENKHGFKSNFNLIDKKFNVMKNVMK